MALCCRKEADDDHGGQNFLGSTNTGASMKPHLRPISPEQQQVAAALYRELAKGDRLTPINWAGRSGSLRRTPKRCSKAIR